jgi:hypothetical protein
VIPVIGRELSILDLPDGPTPISRYLARELTRRMGLDLPESAELEDVVDHVFGHPDLNSDDVHYELRQILTRSQLPTPQVLRQLASITDFDLYITTTFDPLMKQALDEVRGSTHPTQVFTYSRESKMVDLPASYSPGATPVLFRLFGAPGPDNDYALREEDLLQYCQRLLIPDRRPEILFDQLRTRKLLMLGCGFPGWVARFFLAAAKDDRLFTTGAGGAAAGTSMASDKSLVVFLERRKMLVHAGGDAVEFTAELFRRWAERGGGGTEQGLEPAPAAFLPGSIFLSYAREDVDAARRVFQALSRANLDVWFDERSLDPGDQFRDKILANISQCSIFIPLISNNTTKEGKRFFRLEWDEAQEQARYYPTEYPFIQPIVVDQTTDQAPYIPSRFKAANWIRLESGQLPDQFVLNAQKLIRDKRRGGLTA